MTKKYIRWDGGLDRVNKIIWTLVAIACSIGIIAGIYYLMIAGG